MIAAHIDGVVECIDEKDCQKMRDVFDVKVDLGKRVGIGYGITTFPVIQRLRRGIEMAHGLEEAVEMYRNQWTQLALKMANEPMTWCIIMSAARGAQ